jgi:threonine dehydrogenase-like Zn-dependent dehydrogenase
MAGKRIVAAKIGNGTLGLVEEDIPPVVPGGVLVEVKASLVSPGSEVGGWRNLRDEAANPVPLDAPKTFGYANAGIVAEVGAGVADLKVGDRVACIGDGFAQHTDWAVVPHNLCTPLPSNCSFIQGAYAHLAATGVQAVRRSQPELGEYFCVVGLGLVGQLTARLLQLSGAFVMGWDPISFRLARAKAWGIDAVAQPGGETEIGLTKEFTAANGLDGAVLAFGGNGDGAYRQLFKCMKSSPDGHQMGRIVILGGASVNIPMRATNLDIRRSGRTGPGYHDPKWEFGDDYPATFMRWTTKTNLRLALRLISERKLDVDGLTTHAIPLREISAGIGRALDDPDAMLGVVFTM